MSVSVLRRPRASHWRYLNTTRTMSYVGKGVPLGDKKSSPQSWRRSTVRMEYSTKSKARTFIAFCQYAHRIEINPLTCTPNCNQKCATVSTRLEGRIQVRFVTLILIGGERREQTKQVADWATSNRFWTSFLRLFCPLFRHCMV